MEIVCTNGQVPRNVVNRIDVGIGRECGKVEHAGNRAAGAAFFEFEILFAKNQHFRVTQFVHARHAAINLVRGD